MIWPKLRAAHGIDDHFTALLPKPVSYEDKIENRSNPGACAHANETPIQPTDSNRADGHGCRAYLETRKFISTFAHNKSSPLHDESNFILHRVCLYNCSIWKSIMGSMAKETL